MLRCISLGKRILKWLLFAESLGYRWKGRQKLWSLDWVTDCWCQEQQQEGQQTQKKGRKLLKNRRITAELLLMRCNISAVAIHCICLNIMQRSALHTLRIYVAQLPCLMKYIFKLLFSNIHYSVFLLQYSTSRISIYHRISKSKARIHEHKF
jgi:hypothetical protein